MLTVRLATPGDRAAWAAVLGAAPGATVWHRAAFLDLLGRCPGLRTWALIAWRDGEAVGVLPLALVTGPLGRRLLSLPVLDYGGPIALDAEACAALVRHAVALRREVGAEVLEIRAGPGVDPGLPVAPRKDTFLLSLSEDAEGLWEAVGGNVRTAVRKARAAGLRRAVGREELLVAFYGVYARNSRDLGTPVYPRAFFEGVLVAVPEAQVHLVTGGPSGAVVAAALLVPDGRGGAEAPWVASLREARRDNPNEFLYHGLLEDLRVAGVRRFDFGRSTPGSGAWRFKRKFREAVRVPLRWGYDPAEAAAAPNGGDRPCERIAVGVWKRMPLAVANRLGPALARYLP